MLIKDMFQKPINRDIQGVIKVGQSEDENIKQELEEYVVTNELQKHFKDFFTNYKKGIIGETDKMGVWISGFFGSGKSHFIKILSYLLENRIVEGKHVLDYFVDDEKIQDSTVIEDMKLACDTPTDVILFNIDSKSKSSGTKGKDTILNVFLRVFNEMQGFSTDPHLADLERQLLEDGLYDDFKIRYEELNKLNWIENRHKFKFYKDKVIKTLSDMNIMSEESAREWSRTTTRPYEISIEGFVTLVKKYLDSKGKNHHIVFLVDEMGQYIGDNTDLMLNLQTITEDLGTACRGKAWIVVTSQQDIDSITEVSGNDFSKIQGRFDTRLNLTSANVDEVIKLRILEKTEIADETLSILYESNEITIKNLLIFNDGIEKKLYENKKDFSEIYPFIPYQFNLLGSVLTSIRHHGASGKHLSEGERSMLALFKESAEMLMNKEDGEIVPFNIFYDGLEKFLDHSHSAVIIKALENKVINPNNEDENFNVNVLKTLFLIKYVKEIESNLENITTLMVSNIYQDRIKLREKVRTALEILEGQTLVQKNGDVYIFLTNEEQEVNREIDRQHIETQQVTKRIGEIIYDSILSDDRISHDKFGNRYSFKFNKFIDGELYKTNQLFDIGVDIITPNSEKSGVESSLRMISQRENVVYIDLPNNRDFIDEIIKSMKIGQYLRVSSSSDIPKIEEIRALKRIELREHENRGRLYLEDALKHSDVYLNGDKLNIQSTDFKFKIKISLQRLIKIVYHKLEYIDTPMDDINISKLFRKRDNTNIQLNSLESPNINAIREIQNYIKLRTKNYNKISLKEIKDRFSKPPYGFIDTDVEWIISKLFLDGNIGLSLYGEIVSLLTETEDKLIDYITKRQYSEKLLIEEKEVIDERYIRSLKDISSILFDREINSEDTDVMANQFNEYASKMMDELISLKINYSNGNYPGKRVLDEGISLLNITSGLSKAGDIFKEVYKNEDEYLDFEEDYQPVKLFFKGEQINIWDKTEHLISIYKESETYILDKELESIINEMDYILEMPNPYNRIKDLPELNNKFLDLYNDLLDKELQPVKMVIDEEETRVMEELEEMGLEDEFRQIYKTNFNNLREKAEKSNNVAVVNSIKMEANTLKMRYLDEIAKEIDKKNREKKPESGGEKGYSPVIRRKNISIREVNPSNSWRIETKEDLNKYIDDLKKSLEKELEYNTILNIEF